MPAGYEARNYAQGDGVVVEYIQAGEEITAYSLVYLDANGQWALADSDAAATMPCVGLATQNTHAGQKGRVLHQGYAQSNTWAWTAGGEIYASDTAGALSQTPGTIEQVVGIAVSASLIYFDAGGGGGLGAVSKGITRTISAGDTDCGGWNHGMNTSNVSCTPLDEPEAFWWLSIDDVDNVTVHIASPDLQNDHTFRVLVF